MHKLCALLQRSELRDRVDVCGLLASGDLERGLRDAPRKDGGFSPLVLSRRLAGLDPSSMGHAEGRVDRDVLELEAFRDTLIARLSRLSHPGTG